MSSFIWSPHLHGVMSLFFLPFAVASVERQETPADASESKEKSGEWD